jgi:hypothetical protein
MHNKINKYILIIFGIIIKIVYSKIINIKLSIVYLFIRLKLFLQWFLRWLKTNLINQ